MGLGTTEMIIIAALALLFFGATRIPKIARSLGKARGEFEKGVQDGSTPGDSDSDDADSRTE
jgi:TatA/E family protein of Tat protein translocase